MNAKITLKTKTKTKTKTDKLKKLMGEMKNGENNIIQDNIL